MAVCFLVLISLRQRSWMFSDSVGAASWRSRIFYIGGEVGSDDAESVGGSAGALRASNLDVAEHVGLDGREGDRAQGIWN